MTVLFGLIGCGNISKKHLKSLACCEQAKLVAISDLDENRMNNAKQDYLTKLDSDHKINCYKDYKDMLVDDQLDAVIITTLSGLHVEMAKAALLAGKHVILEKPMALSIEEANHLIELAKVKQRELMVCHQLRFSPIMQKAKKIIDDGKLGKLYLGVASISINRSPEYFSSGTWRGKWESDGGMLVNQGIHLVDLLQWFLGDAKTVYGETLQLSSHIKETEDVAIGVITFNNQAKGIVEANIVTKPNNLGYSLSIFGEKGTISIEGPSLNQVNRWFIENEHTNQDELNHLLNDNNEHIYMYENFIDTINTKNRHVLIDGVEGKKALEIIFALYQSDMTQKVINLPIESFSTSDMKRKGGESS